ncbi:MAG: pro-sigmaK processing inhibitor BofA family protein [Oscillospiraceae bacterium]|nr:pro-sigmaK processing inhibitor BofA family protein [Oscillospiraceae bacterium]
MKTVLLVLAAATVIFAAVKLFSSPIRAAFKLLLNTLLGFAALYIFNMFSSLTGITLGLNWFNAAAVGLLGVPGLGLLLLIRWLFRV